MQLYTVEIEIQLADDTSVLTATDQAEGDVQNLRTAVKLVDLPIGSTVLIRVAPQES